jgi:hypothetical protein
VAPSTALPKKLLEKEEDAEPPAEDALPPPAAAAVPSKGGTSGARTSTSGGGGGGGAPAASSASSGAYATDASKRPPSGVATGANRRVSNPFASASESIEPGVEPGSAWNDGDGSARDAFVRDHASTWPASSLFVRARG